MSVPPRGKVKGEEFRDSRGEEEGEWVRGYWLTVIGKEKKEANFSSFLMTVDH